MRWLEPNPQLPSHMLAISQHFYDLAEELLRDIDVDSPQLVLALYKLVEAKDRAVRARSPLRSPRETRSGTCANCFASAPMHAYTHTLC